MSGRPIARLTSTVALLALAGTALAQQPGEPPAQQPPGSAPLDYWSMLFVFMLATFIGIGVIRRVSRLLHTPLMSLTNAISAIAVVGSIIVTGSDHPLPIRILGAIALFWNRQRWDTEDEPLRLAMERVYQRLAPEFLARPIFPALRWHEPEEPACDELRDIRRLDPLGGASPALDVQPAYAECPGRTPTNQRPGSSLALPYLR